MSAVATTNRVGSLGTTAGQEPSVYYERLREQGEVVWDEELGVWLVSSWELIKQIGLGDHDVWRAVSVPDEEYPPAGLDFDEYLELLGPPSRMIFTLQEGAHHARMHRWFMHAFSPKVLARWGDTLIGPIAHAQIDRFAAHGRAELCAEYADRVSPRVTVAVLGLPWADEFVDQTRAIMERGRVLRRDEARDWTTDLTAEVVEAARSSRRELRELFMPYVLERRDGTGDDFISMIWRDGAEIFGPTFGEEEVYSMAALALGAGSGTTGYGVANALYLLLIEPHLREEVRAGGAAAAERLAEEMLRLYGPVEYRARRALRDTTLGGVEIRKGEVVVALGASGGRDPARFECPARVDLRRPAPRAHFGFWIGPRTCPGQALARFQLGRIIAVANERLPDDLRLDPDTPAPTYTGMMVRRWAPLHVRFTPEKP